MAFVSFDPIMGAVDITSIDTVGPGPYNPNGSGAGRQNFIGQELRAYDPNLGGATFVYAGYSATIVAGAVCELLPSLVNGKVVLQATPWTGTANSGKPLCVAQVAGVSGNYGWFQIEGNAIANVSGTPTVGAPVYWQAAGVVSGTAVASKQVIGAAFATTNGITLGSGNAAIVLPSTQAVILLKDPLAQGAIT